MYQKLTDLLKESQLQRNEIQVSTLRLLLSEIKYAQIQKGADLTDPEITSVIQKELKKRREAKDAFTKAKRVDQAQKEQAEETFLSALLPEQLSNEELTKIISDTITELEAFNLSDLGRVMSSVMPKVEGRAEGFRVSAIAKERLLNG